MRRIVLAVAALVVSGCQATPYREVSVDLEDTSTAAQDDDGPRAAPALRFAVAAMESPRDTSSGYSRLLERMALKLGTEVDLVQRRTYREVNDLLRAGRLDLALVCTGGYLDMRRHAPTAFELIAVPVVDGETTYHSLVVVPAESPARSLDDLEGKRFAFTDELSFSGHTYLAETLRGRGQSPDHFFASTLYTHSHDRSIRAVADGIVDGAVVSSVIYRHQIDLRPEVGARTRIIERSPAFGVMPIMASTRLSPARRDRIRRVLLGLHHDPEAAAAMRFLHIDRFEVPAPGLYDSAAALLEHGG